MRIQTIIHASFEKPGEIKTWATKNGLYLTTINTYAGDSLPNPEEVDLLILMGGPQSATELDNYPYLKQEVSFTKKIIDLNKPVLGICLGAQIIGACLGAKTERSEHKEVGLFPIRLTTEGREDPVFKNFPESFDVMHWHGDMPGLTQDAVLLATSAGCSRQAIRYKERVYGLQFHLEMTPPLVQTMIDHCPDDLQPGTYIRSKQDLLASELKAVNEKIHVMLDYLISFC
jgi:GMP synthase (glutamine-hydrolysing)